MSEQYTLPEEVGELESMCEVFSFKKELAIKKCDFELASFYRDVCELLTIIVKKLKRGPDRASVRSESACGESWVDWQGKFTTLCEKVLQVARGMLDDADEEDDPKVLQGGIRERSRQLSKIVSALQEDK